MKARCNVSTPVTVLFFFVLAGVTACCGGRRISSEGDLQPRLEPSPPIGKAHFDVPQEAEPASATQTEMRNVNFRFDDAIILHIHHLRGEMFDQRRGDPLNFDDKRSFVFRIANGEIGMNGPTLSALMNDYVFAYRGAPLRDLQITIEGNRLRQEGIMHKIIDIPFTMFADISMTPEGWIRLHPTEIEICDLNGKALMKAFGLSLEKLLDLSKAKGVRADGNDLLLDPLHVLPPPAVEGRLTAVRIDGDEVMQVWESSELVPPLPLPFPEEPNFMYYREGTLRMGKLFMVRADMQVVDTDPTDPFDFFLDFYNNQLAAGFTENQSNYGLKVFMRDFSDLGKPMRPGERFTSSPLQPSPVDQLAGK